MNQRFRILVVITSFIIIILFLATLPTFNYIVSHPRETILKPIAQQVQDIQKPKPPSKPEPRQKHYQKGTPVLPQGMTPEQGYIQYLAQEKQEEFQEAGGIENWINQNPPNSLLSPYQTTFVEVWTAQFPYMCLYSDYAPGRMKQTAEELTKDAEGCLGVPSCDLMVLIEELIYTTKSSKTGGCGTPITQKWSYPPTQPPHDETSIVMAGVIQDRRYRAAVGKDIIVRILLNPKPNPNAFRTNWQDMLKT